MHAGVEYYSPLIYYKLIGIPNDNYYYLTSTMSSSSNSKQSYYAVAEGRNVGVYQDWATAKDQVNGYSGNVHQKFSSADAAHSFVRDNRK